LRNSDRAEEEWWMDIIDAIHSRRSIRSYQSNSTETGGVRAGSRDAAHYSEVGAAPGRFL
jgi:hypothetical protein